MTPVQAAYGSLVLMLFGGSLAMLVYLLWRLLSNLPIVPREPRANVPWGLIDILLTFALYITIAISLELIFPVDRADLPAEPAAQQQIEKEPRSLLTLSGWKTMIAVDSSAKLITVVVMVLFLMLRVRATMQDFGWTLSQFGYDVMLGAATFLAMYLPMMGLQITLVYGLDWKYDHPLIASVSETKDQVLFALATLAAAVCAPLVEEFVFRGLIQGWLEKLLARRREQRRFFVGEEVSEFETATVEEIEPAPGNQVIFADHLNKPKELPAATVPRLGWLAILLTAVLFALMHFSHGPAWIPLLVFGAATGFVYQRTHRLWPGIIAHVLLNGVSMFGLWVQVFGK
jgi:membrane protease YdiL (CAAX protease family)